MPTFTYQVRDEKGKKLKGELEAASEKALADRLMHEGYLVTSVKPGRRTKVPGPIGFLLGPRISMADLSMFYFQLGNMLEAGIPLLAALRAVTDQIDKRLLRRTIQDLGDLVERGETFSKALGHHPRAFPTVYRTMVEVGETSGNLDKVLRYVAELNERREELTHQVRSALAYPMVLMVASLAVVIFMMVWIVPAFTMIFTKAGIPLPLPTRLIYGLSLWMKSNFGWFLTGLAAGAVGLRFLLQTNVFKYYWDRFWLSLAVVGPLIIRVEISRWSRSVALMLSSGVPILKTLEVTRNLTENRLFQIALKEASNSVQKGETLAEYLKKGRLFPAAVVQMVSTGEHSGTLDKMLYKVANFYDQLVQRSFKKLTAVIEPIFILFMGGVVGFIMLSVLLPIFDMLELLQIN